MDIAVALNHWTLNTHVNIIGIALLSKQIYIIYIYCNILCLYYNDTMPIHHKSEANPGLDRTYYELRASGVKLTSANPLYSGIHSRGYLRHIKREGVWYFVTFRLADALPQEVLLQFRTKQAERLRNLHKSCELGQPRLDTEPNIQRDFSRQIERYLDRGCGACYMLKPEIAQLVCTAIRYFEGEKYLLESWVVMPNHVHALLWPKPNHTLSEILKSWKQYSSRQAKQLIGLEKERFWQPESYSHWIRNDAEKARINRYIQCNPVVAKLCVQPEDWRWSSVGCGVDKPPPVV